MGNLDVPDERMLAVGDFLLGIRRTGNRPFHVGLTGAQPDLAHKDILQNSFPALTGYRQFASHEAFLHSRQLGRPLPFRADFDGNFLAAEIDLHFFAGVTPTPEDYFLARLQHHVVAEQVGEAKLGEQ